MNIEEMIADFEQSEEETPYLAAQWALDNWDLAAPPLLERLEAFVARADVRDETIDLLFTALMVMAEKREAGAFPPLCRLMHDAAHLDALFIGTESTFLAPMLISTFNGDAAALRDVVSDPEASPDGRACALDALSYLAAGDTIAKSAFHDDLAAQFDTLRPRAENMVWVGMVLAVARLGFADLADKARQAFAHGWVPEEACGLADFNALLEQEIASPSGTEGFEEDGVGPLVDAIDALEMIDEAGDPDELPDQLDDEDDDPDSERPVYQAPVTNPLRHVGRNDPCPCGSGKKYKKCCLV